MARDAPVFRLSKGLRYNHSSLSREERRENAVHLILSGAEITKGARRLARGAVRGTGSLEPRPLGVVAAALGHRYETWGIVIEAPYGPAGDGPHCGSGHGNDGRVFAVDNLSC